MPFSTQVASGRTRILHTHPGPLHAPEQATTRAIATLTDPDDAATLVRTLTGIEHALSVALICGAGDDDTSLPDLAGDDGDIRPVLDWLAHHHNPDRPALYNQDSVRFNRIRIDWGKLLSETLPRAVADALPGEMVALIAQLATDAYDTSTPLGAARALYAHAAHAHTCDSPLDMRTERAHDLWTDGDRAVTCRFCRSQFTYTVLVDERETHIEDAERAAARQAAQPAPESTGRRRRPSRSAGPAPAKYAHVDVDAARGWVEAWAQKYAGAHVYRPAGTFVLLRVLAEQTGGLAGRTPGHLLSFDKDVPPAPLFAAGRTGSFPTGAEVSTLNLGTVAIPSGQLAFTPDEFITAGHLTVPPGTYEVTLTTSNYRASTTNRAFVSVWADRDTPHTTVQRAVDHRGNVMAVQLAFDDVPYPLFVTDQSATPFLAAETGFEALYVEDPDGEYDSHPWIDLMDSPDHLVVGAANIPVPNHDGLNVVMVDADTQGMKFPVYVTLGADGHQTGWHVDLMSAHQIRPLR